MSDTTDRFLSETEVLITTGLSRMTRWRLEKEGDFPKRRKISSQKVGWLESEIKEWINTRPVSTSEFQKAV